MQFETPSTVHVRFELADGLHRQLIFGGGVGFRIRGRWSGSVALGVITIRSTGLAYAVPQAGVAYTILP